MINCCVTPSNLKTVKADVEIRFWDVANLDVPDWVTQPFQADVF